VMMVSQAVCIPGRRRIRRPGMQTA